MGDEKKEKKGDEEDDVDARLEYLMNYLMKSMKIKPDRWVKMMALEENKVRRSLRHLTSLKQLLYRL